VIVDRYVRISLMPSSASSSAQAARQRLAVQLRQLRDDAGLSGVAFAAQAGWRDSTKVSQIERGLRPASASDVQLWCRLCGASEQRTQELLAEQAAVAGMWVTYKQLNRGGLKGAQESVRSRYERLNLLRVYQTRVIPGLLQTEAYTTAALTEARRKQNVAVDDVAAAVAERMDRQRVLQRPDARFLFVLEEDVLWRRPYPRQIHADQLQQLLVRMRQPSVSLGIIPRTVDRQRTLPAESFTFSDGNRVTVELVSGYLSVTHPDEIAMYEAAWERLFALAVHGNGVIALIRQALAGLDG
jgi:transcriptional regulator with XRE-family HTH domain